MSWLKNIVSVIFCGLLLTGALTACGGGGGGTDSILPVTPLNSKNSKGPKPTSSATPGATTSSATPTPGPAPANILHHIPTWVYDEYNSEGGTASSSQVRQYVTYAEGGLGNAKAVADCGGSNACSSVFYLNSNKIYDSSICPDSEYAPFVAASSENWYVHESGFTDKAHRVSGTYSVTCSNGTDNENVWVANNASAGVQNYFNTYLQTSADAWNYYFMDDTAGTVVDQMYGSSGGFCGGNYCTTTQELPTDTSVVQSHASMANALNHINGSPMQFFYNGLSFDGAQNANDIDILQSSNRFSGAVCENCIVNSNVFETAMYAPVLNAMATINNTTNGSFVLLSTGNQPAGSASQIAQRIVTTAVAWLGYSDGHTVVWPNLEYNTNNLAVWPEDEIYPAQALESMSSGASDIQVAPGVWRREFAACYNNGVSIGHCAAILNANTSPVVVLSSWLQQSYGHSVQLNGGDLLNGGSLSLQTTSFIPSSTSVPGGQALLLVP